MHAAPSTRKLNHIANNHLNAGMHDSIYSICVMKYNEKNLRTTTDGHL